MESFPSSPKETSHLFIVSQVVDDIKVDGGQKRDALAHEVGRLRAALRDKAYIPGDKITATYTPVSLSDDGVLEFRVSGGMLEEGAAENGRLPPEFTPKFPLDLRPDAKIGDVTKMELHEIIKNCNGVECDDGGNAQNMAINACLAGMSALEGKLKISVFSSSDPLKRIPANLRAGMEKILTYYPLEGIEDRRSMQFPWVSNGQKGDFGLNSDPVDTALTLKDTIFRSALGKAFTDVDCFIAADSAFLECKRLGTIGHYSVVVNSATKWRSTVASLVNGSDVILPMNKAEAADVARIVVHKGAEKEMNEIKSVFPSPLKPNGNEIDPENLSLLDDSLWKYSNFNHPHSRSDGRTSFNYPITFDHEGGLVVGTLDRNSIGVFTSTIEVGSQQERLLMDEYGVATEMRMDEINTVGAGDAAATVVTLFNAVDPDEFFKMHYEGREKSNANLRHVAQTIFVSALSRIVGSFVLHTSKCNWSNANLEKFHELFSEVAKDSLDLARSAVNQPSQPRMSELSRFGIKVVTWGVGTVRPK